MFYIFVLLINVWLYQKKMYHNLYYIGGVMDSVLTTSAVDRGFEPRWSYTKNYIIDFRCLSDKHASLRRKSRDWLARNQNIVSNWSDISNKN